MSSTNPHLLGLLPPSPFCFRFLSPHRFPFLQAQPHPSAPSSACARCFPKPRCPEPPGWVRTRHPAGPPAPQPGPGRHRGHLGQQATTDLFSLIPQSPQKVLQHGQAGRGMFWDGAAGGRSARHRSVPSPQKGRLILGHFLAPGGFTRLPARPGASTHLQRGGHGLVPVHGRADAQVPRDADGVGRHGEALEHDGILPLTAVLPGEASNLRHRGEKSQIPGLPCPGSAGGFPRAGPPTHLLTDRQKMPFSPPIKPNPPSPSSLRPPTPRASGHFRISPSEEINYNPPFRAHFPQNPVPRLMSPHQPGQPRNAWHANELKNHFSHRFQHRRAKVVKGKVRGSGLAVWAGGGRSCSVHRRRWGWGSSQPCPGKSALALHFKRGGIFPQSLVLGRGRRA